MTFYVVRAPFDRRTVIPIALLFALIFECGCTTARPVFKSIWEQVPPVRWSNRGHDSVSSSKETETPTEPTIAANVAVKAESTADAGEGTFAVSNGNRRKSKSLRIKPRPNLQDTRSAENDWNTETANIDDSPTESQQDAIGVDSSMEKLNAALSDDSLQAQSLPLRSLTTLEARIRVDSLLVRAREMLEIGQLEQARQTALLAQDLSDSVQLDYAPDDDRPNDLVRRIESQQQTNQFTDEIQDDNSLEATVPTSDPLKSEVSAKSMDASGPTAKETSRFSRIRRDLSTLFRREKKQPVLDADNVSRDSKTVKSVSAVAVPGRIRNVKPQTESSNRDAVVMANRSVLLDVPKSEDCWTEADSVDGEPSSTDLSHADSQPHSESEILESLGQEVSSFGNLADAESLKMDDDELNVQPDFDAGDSSIPSHIVDPVVDHSDRTKIIDTVEESRSTDWIPLYIVFGVCSVLALSCYRRGAV